MEIDKHLSVRHDFVTPGVMRMLLVASVLTFLLFCFNKAGSYFGQDEAFNYRLGLSCAEHGRPIYYEGEPLIYSPPLYLYALGLSFALFGSSPTASCIPGILFVLLAGLLGIKLCEKCGVSTRGTVVFSLLYFLSPAHIHGAVIKDIDNTLLILTTTLFIYFYLFGKDTRHRDTRLAGLFALALWSKLTTPFLLIPAAFLYEILSGRRPWRLVKVFLLGIGMFAVTYWPMCLALDLPLAIPFQYLFVAGGGKLADTLQWNSFGYRAAASVSSLVLWTTPFLPVLALTATRETIRRWGAVTEAHFLFIWSVLILFAYTFLLGGSAFGFPKYYMPAFLPLLVFSVYYLDGAMRTLSARDLRIAAVLIVVGAALFTVAGDPVYWVRYELKEAAITFADRTSVLVSVTAKFAVYFGIGLALWALAKTTLTASNRVATAIALILVLITSDLGLDFRQAFAGYNTAYYYGDRDIEAVISRIRQEHLSPDEILAPEHIIFWGINRPHNVPNHLWNDKHAFLSAVRNRKMRCVIYSTGHNTISQFNTTFADPEVRKVLLSEYSLAQIGTHWIWTRKDQRSE